jgi:hypothetical protein
MGSNASANIESLHRALYYKGRLWILVKYDLRQILCEIVHDSKVTSYISQHKTRAIMKPNVFWLGIDMYIKDFDHSCESCQCTKAPRHVRYSLLSPLELAYAPEQSISIDFIVDLPKSNEHTRFRL